MNTYLRWALGVLLGGPMVAWAIYHGYLFAAASRSGLVAMSGVLVAWLVLYLVWGRKLTARLRKEWRDEAR